MATPAFWRPDRFGAAICNGGRATQKAARPLFAALAFRAPLLLGSAAALDKLHRKDRNLVQQKRRYGEADLAHNVRRREYRRDREDDDDGIAPLLSEPLRGDHAHAS